MPRRLPRILLNAATAASLLLAAASLAVWDQSRRSPTSLAVFGRPPFRYTLHAEHGRLRLDGPPVVPPADLAAARARLDGLDNRAVQWVFIATGEHVRVLLPYFGDWRWAALSAAPRLSSAEEAVLLAPLDDPDRFAAAHVALRARKPLGERWDRAADGTPIWNWAGLHVRTPRPTTADIDTPAGLAKHSAWKCGRVVRGPRRPPRPPRRLGHPPRPNPRRRAPLADRPRLPPPPRHPRPPPLATRPTPPRQPLPHLQLRPPRHTRPLPRMRNHPRHPTTYNLILLIPATPALVFRYAPFAWVTFVAYALPTLIALVAGALAVYRGYFASMITGA